VLESDDDASLREGGSFLLESRKAEEGRDGKGGNEDH
jgi:hypothetical protein